MTLKIGAVSYLNTKPLVHTLQTQNQDFQLSFELPSRLADQLKAGKLDIALIPTIELLRSGDYKVVSDACIACRGPVRSVKLLSKVPFDRISVLAMDVGSRTSIALAKILLQKRFGIEPIEMGLPISSDWRTQSADAVLIIGDRAMNPEIAPFQFAWDLGEQWYLETGLPFVFAVWAAHRDLETKAVGDCLNQARDDGVLSIEQISQTESGNYQISPAECLTYLSKNLHFTLGTQERKGLELYQQLAYELNLIPERHDIEYPDCVVQ